MRGFILFESGSGRLLPERADLHDGRRQDDREQDRKEEDDHRHVSFGGRAAAFFSASIMRLSRLSCETTRKA